MLLQNEQLTCAKFSPSDFRMSAGPYAGLAQSCSCDSAGPARKRLLVIPMMQSLDIITALVRRP
eukprot:3347812-Amphidinium_carterae.1